MKKLLYLIFGIALLAIAGNASATTDWYGPAHSPGVSQDWFTASNWSLGVPDIALQATQGGVRTYGGTNYDTSLTTCPIISSGAATTLEVRVGGANAGTPATATTAYLTMNSGSLSTQNFLMIGPDSATGGGRSGTVVMHGGNMILGGAQNGVRTSGHLYVGFGSGTYTGIVGTLTMDGGTIDAGGDFAIGKNYSQGYVNPSGTATILANNFFMRPDNAAAVANIDISGAAKVVINGDKRTTIETYIDNGWIKTNGVAWTDYTNLSYNAGTNKTTLMVPEPATICLLGIGLFGLIRRK